MPDTDNHTADTKERIRNVPLTDAQRQDLEKTIKRGIYRELHKRAFLSDAQLNDLIKRNT